MNQLPPPHQCSSKNLTDDHLVDVRATALRPRVYRYVSIFLTLFLCFNLFFEVVFNVPDPTEFNLSEFLINFEGGFVRRGLIGQLLYWATGALRCDPVWLVSPLCIAAYVGVVTIFLHYFKQRQWSWWLIASPFLCGSVCSMIRKDYLQILLFAALLILINKRKYSIGACVVAILGIVLGLFIHEAFVFWGLPVLLLLVWRNCRASVAVKALLSVIPIVVFVLLSYYKGDTAIMGAINRSWEGIYGPGYSGQSIESLGWTLSNTFRFHLTKNFGIGDFGVHGFLVRPFIFLAIYYFVINALAVFRYKGRIYFSVDDQTNLSALFLLTCCCLLPMFTVLSCDWGRIYQYAITTSFLTLAVVPRATLTTLFPEKWRRRIAVFNSLLCRFVRPQFGLLLVLLLFLAEAPYYFDPGDAVASSIIFRCIMRSASALLQVCHLILG